jgi:hypothetical protein
MERKEYVSYSLLNPDFKLQQTESSLWFARNIPAVAVFFLPSLFIELTGLFTVLFVLVNFPSFPHQPFDTLFLV